MTSPAFEAASPMRSTFWTLAQVLAWVIFRDPKILRSITEQARPKGTLESTMPDYCSVSPAHLLVRVAAPPTPLSLPRDSYYVALREILEALARGSIAARGVANYEGQVKQIARSYWDGKRFEYEEDTGRWYAGPEDSHQTDITKWYKLRFRTSRIFKCWPRSESAIDGLPLCEVLSSESEQKQECPDPPLVEQNSVAKSESPASVSRGPLEHEIVAPSADAEPESKAEAASMYAPRNALTELLFRVLSRHYKNTGKLPTYRDLILMAGDADDRQDVISKINNKRKYVVWLDRDGDSRITEFRKIPKLLTPMRRSIKLGHS